jgi:hypothetical protein
MIKDIDIFKTEKEVPNYIDYLYKTIEEFNAKAKKWADKKGYSTDKYILNPLLTWTKEAPFKLMYKLEVKEFIKEE